MIIQNDGGIFFALALYIHRKQRKYRNGFCSLARWESQTSHGTVEPTDSFPPVTIQHAKNQQEIWPGLTTYWKYINEYSIKWLLVINFCTLKLAPHASYLCWTQYLQASIIPSTMIPLWEPACTNLALGPRLHCLKHLWGCTSTQSSRKAVMGSKSPESQFSEHQPVWGNPRIKKRFFAGTWPTLSQAVIRDS